MCFLDWCQGSGVVLLGICVFVASSKVARIKLSTFIPFVLINNENKELDNIDQLIADH